MKGINIMFKKFFKKNKKEEPILAINAVRNIIRIIDNNDIINKQYKDITNYLSKNNIKGYNSKDFEYYQDEFYLFFNKIIPYILIDETCILWCLILKKITSGRDDTFLYFIHKNKTLTYNIIENHVNFNLLLMHTPSKNIYYSSICNQIDEISIESNKKYYIDILVFLKDNNLFNDDYVVNTYLIRDNKEKTVEEFNEKLSLYVNKRNLINKLKDF
jgi:hypothetical protein